VKEETDMIRIRRTIFGRWQVERFAANPSPLWHGDGRWSKVGRSYRRRADAEASLSSRDRAALVIDRDAISMELS
jgi:hypothetical protein